MAEAGHDAIDAIKELVITALPSDVQVAIDMLGEVAGGSQGGAEEESIPDDEEAKPPTIPLAGGSQGGHVELAPHINATEQGQVNATEKWHDNETEEGHTQGLLTTLLGYKVKRETIAHIIALIGLGTITSTIGGYFARGPPSLFVYFLIDQEYYWDLTDDISIRDFLIQRDATVLYYKCLPAFFIIGVLELCYGKWLSWSQSHRAGPAGKRVSAVLVLSAFLFIVTVCFTGASVNI